MKRIALIMVTMSGIAAVPVASLAQSATTTAAGQSEEQMFLASRISLKQATDIALREVPGTVSAVGFNDENGKGVYEAMVVAKDGQSSIVKIDANTGAVLGKGLALLMDDEEDGADGTVAENAHDDENGDGDGEGGMDEDKG